METWTSHERTLDVYCRYFVRMINRHLHESSQILAGYYRNGWWIPFWLKHALPVPGLLWLLKEKTRAFAISRTHIPILSCSCSCWMLLPFAEVVLLLLHIRSLGQGKHGTRKVLTFGALATHHTHAVFSSWFSDDPKTQGRQVWNLFGWESGMLPYWKGWKGWKGTLSVARYWRDLIRWYAGHVRNVECFFEYESARGCMLTTLPDQPAIAATSADFKFNSVQISADHRFSMDRLDGSWAISLHDSWFATHLLFLKATKYMLRSNYAPNLRDLSWLHCQSWVIFGDSSEMSDRVMSECGPFIFMHSEVPNRSTIIV